MNYLSHFYIDHQLDQPYYNTGLILPDLARSTVKHFKTSATSFITQNHLELHAGCLRHYERDRTFHASPFFDNYYQQILEVVNHAGFSNQLQRKWFLSHLIVELMLDRTIVKFQSHIPDLFYQSLRSIDLDSLKDYLSKFNATSIDSFVDRFKHFRDVAYIYYYADTNKFVYSLTRIMMRAGLPEASATDQQILGAVCEDIESRFFKDSSAVLNELKKVFDV